MNRLLLKVLLNISLIWLCSFSTVAAQVQPVHMRVDLGNVKGPMKPIWAWFGYDEPNYTYMKDGRKLLSELQALSPVPVYVRTHNLLTSGDAMPALKWGSTNVYTEDAAGNPVYHWNIVDSIFDTYIQRGMKPLAQIGFMPEALSTHPDPYKHHWKPGDPYSYIMTGWAYPPKDYNKWRELVYQWVTHCVMRYGAKEVESWYWEVWNEPNGYWKGTEQEFFKLYDYTAAAVKKALPTARIGGLNIAGTSGASGSKWLDDFIRHCLYDTNYVTGSIGAPLDALLFHAKGNPTLKNGVVWMNMSGQLRDIEMGMKLATKYPATKDLPLIVGESDPEGCAACGMATNPSNAYRNGTMYSSYTAATFARKFELADTYHANLIGAVSWSFEFENQPWFYGFRDLATNGVDKPVLNVFRMFGMMHGDRVEASSDWMYDLNTVKTASVRDRTDVGVLASKDPHGASIMIWNYHDEDKTDNPESIEINIDQIPVKKIKLTEYRIDATHSNSYERWKKMGSPQQPTDAQIKELEQAGMLQTVSSPVFMHAKSGKALLNLSLPRQAVGLLKLEW